MRDAGNLESRLRKTDRSIDEDDTHARPVHRHFGAQVAVCSMESSTLALAAQAGSIDERNTPYFVFDGFTASRVPAMLETMQRFSPETRFTGRFADVRLSADDGDPRSSPSSFFLFPPQMLEDGIQQVACAVSVHGRHLNGVAEAEVIKTHKKPPAGRPAYRTLLTHTMTGTLLRWSICAMLRSVATMPVRTSVTKMMQSAESMAICACVRIWDKNNILRFRLDAARIYQ